MQSPASRHHARSQALLLLKQASGSASLLGLILERGWQTTEGFSHHEEQGG